MLKTLRRVAGGLWDGFNALIRLSGISACILVVTMQACVLYEVIARHFFRAPTGFLGDEIATYLLVATTFLGWSYALRNDRIIRITIITERLPLQIQEWLEVFATSIAFIATGVVLWQISGYVFNTFERGLRSGSVLNVPLVIPQFTMLIGLVLVLAESLLHFARSLVSLGKRRT